MLHTASDKIPASPPRPAGRPRPARRDLNFSILRALPECRLLAHQRARIRASTHSCGWSCSHCGSRCVQAYSQNEPRRLSCSRADIPASGVRGCWSFRLDQCLRVVYTPGRLTSSVSRAAMRSTGIRTATKKMDRIANPFAARVYRACGQPGSRRTDSCVAPYDNSVIPGEYGKLIQACNEIPARGDVAS